MNREKPTIYSIQMLRAIAALFVVIAHAQIHLEARGLIPELNPLLDLGRVGVDLFFVISGFIMVYIAGSKFSKPGATRDFLIRRAIRIVPIYWIYTVVLAVLMILLPQLVSQGKSVGFVHFIASLFFIPWENNIGYIKPLLSVGWTLNFEIYFYLLFGILLFIPKKYFLVTLSIIMVSGIIIGIVFHPVPPYLYVLSSPLLLEFLMGCLIGTIYTSRLTLPRWTAYFLVALGIIGYIYSISDTTIVKERFIFWGLPSALLICGTLFLEKTNSLRISHLLVKLGDSSYSLYLTHIFTINALGKMWIMIFNDYLVIFIILATLISAIIGYSAYLILERPIINFLNKKYKNYKLSKMQNPI